MEGTLCRNLPLNKFEVATVSEGNLVRVSAAPPGQLDWEALDVDWAARVGGVPGLVHDLGIALIRQFVRRVVLTDPQGYAALANQPVLYLGNHQTGVESLLFLSIAVSLGQTPVAVIAKQEHHESWIGLIQQMAELAMGARNPLKLLLFDRARPSELLQLLGNFGAGLADTPCSLLVHTDGTRSLIAGQPVQSVSPVLLDLALAHDLPIVPVRFAGGLPLTECMTWLEFPYLLGQQDYYIGTAIRPERLRALPYAHRGPFIRDRMNCLGPNAEADMPLPGNVEIAHAVAAARVNGRTEVQAVLRAVLESFPALREQSASLLRDPGSQSCKAITRLTQELVGSAEPGVRC